MIVASVGLTFIQSNKKRCRCKIVDTKDLRKIYMSDQQSDVNQIYFCLNQNVLFIPKFYF